MTVDQSMANRTAESFFGTWPLLALAIADLPLAPGFVFVEMVLLACALLVYLRVPVNWRWQTEGARGRVPRVVRDGFPGGGAIALLSRFSPGDPSQHPAALVGPPDWNQRLDGPGRRQCAGSLRLRLMAMPANTSLNSRWPASSTANIDVPPGGAGAFLRIPPNSF